MDKPSRKLVQRLKDESRKTMCNYNKLEDAHSTHPPEIQKNDNTKCGGVNKNCSDFRMFSNESNHQLEADCCKHCVVYEEHMVTTN